MSFSLLRSVFLLLIFFVKSEQDSEGVGNYFMNLYKDVSLPSGLTNCEISLEVTLLSCAQICASTRTCVSMYAVLDRNTVGNLKWRCHSCRTIVTGTTFPHGDGYYAVMKHIDLGNSPPTVPSGTFHKIDYINGVKAAFYNCSIGFIKIRLAVDPETGMWPRLRGACLENLCSQAALSTCAAHVTFDSSGFIFQPGCAPDETTDGSSRCSFEGAWTLTSQSGVHCISSTCYRKNSGHRTFYKGFKTTTKHGRTCQKWESMSPHSHTNRYHHLYVVDGNYHDAKNYCRDPDTSGAPWCYTITSVRWEYCGIPLCQ